MPLTIHAFLLIPVIICLRPRTLVWDNVFHPLGLKIYSRNGRLKELHRPMDIVVAAEAEALVGRDRKYHILSSFRASQTPLSRFLVVASPSNAFALTNRIVMHPSSGFREGDHVLVKDSFPMTVKYARVFHGTLKHSDKSIDWITRVHYSLVRLVPHHPSVNGLH